MKVRHNTTAINANRNFNLVTGAQQKDAEKLSSGYRINRAADDAAGLAISEKMRRQVRGLTQASTNAQDGISYVQSAEGALNEVHDILQRANELAVKAGNDTNMSDDREYIYKEIEQLHTEIDRIARDTQFNEMEVFDSENAEPYGGNTRHVPRDVIVLDADYVTFDMQSFTTAINDAAKVGKTFTQVQLADFANKLKDDYLPGILDKITKALPSATPTVGDLQIGLKLYCEKENGVLAYVGSNGISYELGVNLWYREPEGDGLKMTSDLASTIAHEMTHAVMFDVTTNGMLGSGGADAFPSWFVEGTAQAIGGAYDYLSELTYGINRGGWDDKKIQKWLNDLYDTSDSYNSYAQGYLGSLYLGYVVGGEGEISADKIAGGLNSILQDIQDGFSLGQAISRKTNGKYEDLADFEKNFSKDALQFTKDFVKKVGDAGGNGSVVTDLTDKSDALLTGGDKNNFFTLNVDVESYSNTKELAGKNVYTGGGATTSGGLKRDGTTNPDAEQKWGTSMSGSSLMISANIFVQVGAEAGEHIDISTFKLSAKDLGLTGIKVDSMENAGDAIERYKKAIEMVSNMRSEFGAVQNRLEHTVTNLDNVVENTQSAESAIRDTDIADTMVRYSNGNILAQAGSSMLAQANQSNQLALQLLG